MQRERNEVMEGFLIKLLGRPEYARILMESKLALTVMLVLLLVSGALMFRGFKRLHSDTLTGTFCLSSGLVLLILLFYTMIFVSVFGVNLP